MGFCSPVNLAVRGWSEHPRTVILIVTISVGKEKGKGGTLKVNGREMLGFSF